MVVTGFFCTVILVCICRQTYEKRTQHVHPLPESASEYCASSCKDYACVSHIRNSNVGACKPSR